MVNPKFEKQDSRRSNEVVTTCNCPRPVFTVTVHFCVQHDGRKAATRAGPSAAAIDFTCMYLPINYRTQVLVTGGFIFAELNFGISLR